MDQQTVHTQFWRLPNVIRSRYVEKNIRRVDIVGEGTKQVVLILLSDGHTDTWRCNSHWDSRYVPVGWHLEPASLLVDPTRWFDSLGGK
jgi:hypothetical protein